MFGNVQVRSSRRQRTLHLIGNACFLAVIAAGWLVIGPSQLGGPMTYVVVQGNSMQPQLQSGDFVVTRQQTDYQQGDIILFRKYGGYVIHRIVDGSPAHGWRVQGINNPSIDPWVVKNQDILGKYIWSSATVGAVATWIREHALVAGLIFVGIAALLCTPWPRRRESKAGEPVASTTETHVQMPAAVNAALTMLSVATIAAAMWSLAVVSSHSGISQALILSSAVTMLLAASTYALLRFAITQHWLDESDRPRRTAVSGRDVLSVELQDRQRNE